MRIGYFSYIKPKYPIINSNGIIYNVSNRDTNRALDNDSVYFKIIDENYAMVVGIHQRNICNQNIKLFYNSS